ncbi:hypothetical protein IG631_20195 [Alternaria alternata]|nr:hypothetical protein IG631_20195 [Alternaria alternata]
MITQCRMERYEAQTTAREFPKSHWIWDHERQEFYYINFLDETRVYNTLQWDPENHMYIRRHDDGTGMHWNGMWFSDHWPGDELGNSQTRNASGHDEEVHHAASKALNQTDTQPPPAADNITDSLLDLVLEDQRGCASNSQTEVEWGTRIAGSSLGSDNNQDKTIVVRRASPDIDELPHYMSSEISSLHTWKELQSRLPSHWKWDVEYHSTKANYSGQHGCWTSTPMESNEPKEYPLRIGNAPVVLPVEYQWPPIGGVTPPPDPRATAPIDCRANLPWELVKDIFLTFEGSIGFYILINGLLQIIVPEDHDIGWASSHLPHKYGGLKVCYIEQTLEPTMLPTKTETSGVTDYDHSPESSQTTRSSQAVHLSAKSFVKQPSLKLNDLIEARPLSNHRREKFSGRIGLKVSKFGIPLIVMSTHVITEAIIAKSHRDTLLGRKDEDRVAKLQGDWNARAEIWTGHGKIGTIQESFDKGAGIYPNGFGHDITLINPTSPAVVKDIVSPVADLGWLSHSSWTSLRQQTSIARILADVESSQSAKTIRCSRPSDILVVGEGIFLNQNAAAGGSRTLKDHDASTWKELVSRALLYRIYPDFDPPNGHSGTALFADGVRENGTQGPGIVGFQSFVQRSGHVQNFDMEGSALERRLQLGRVAFYGAFEVPTKLKRFDII